jgi:hypothetical protein
MCDEESSGLQNIPQSHPRREPKIILQRAEYRFPALKNSLVSVFVFVHIEQNNINVGTSTPKHFSPFVQLN